MATPLAVGTASAAPPPPTVTAVTVTSVTNSPAGTPATIVGTDTPAAGVGGTAPSIEYTVLGGHDPATLPAGSGCTADVSGNFSCSIANPTGTAGTDTIRVFADVNGDNTWNATEVKSADTTVIFSGAPATIALTSPGPSSATGTCAAYSALVKDGNGAVAAGQHVTLTLSETTTSNPGATPFTLYTPTTPSGAPCAGTPVTGGTTVNNLNGTWTVTATPTLTVGNDGTVNFGVASSAAGTGSVKVSSGAVSDSKTVTWSSGGANSVANLTVTSTNPTTQYAGTSATYTVKATDTGGNPVQGVAVNEETTGGPDTIAPTTVCGTTDNNGLVTCTVNNGGTAGTDALTFFVNNTLAGTHTNGPDSPEEPQVTASAVFNAAPVVSAAQSTLKCVQQLAGANKGTAQTNCSVPTSTTSVTYTATVKDATGTPIQGAIVTFTTTSATLNGATVTGTGLATGSGTSDANGVATFTVTNPTPANGDHATVSAAVGATSIGSPSTVTWASPHATSLTVTPPLQSVTKSGTVTVKASVSDQFGTPVSGTPSISYSVAGRNNGKTGSAAADGTITYTDAGTNAASNTDTISVLDNTDAFNGSATVDYVTGATTASTVGVDTSGLGVSDVTCGVATNVAATGVALQHTTEVCALVKNATGEVLAGKSVTFTVSNGQVDAHGALATTSTKTYTATTDAAGVAFADVTGTTTGAQTVTATADSATGTGTVTYSGPTAAQAYKVVATPATGTTINPGSSQKFTATVTDKFGNPVPNVVVLATQSGTGSTTGGNQLITAADGTVSVLVSTVASDTGSGSVAFNIGSALTIPPNQCATTGGACSATATYTVASSGPSTLALTHETGARSGTHETLTATAKNSDGTAAANVIVRFFVKGVNTASGSATTGSTGRASFTYLATHHGVDKVAVYADSNNDQIREANEPVQSGSVRILSPEHANITLVAHTKTAAHGSVTVHVRTNPVVTSTVVKYYVKKSGTWVKIGTGTTGHLGKASKSFTEVAGKTYTFRVKVRATSKTVTGTSPSKSVKVNK